MNVTKIIFFFFYFFCSLTKALEHFEMSSRQNISEQRKYKYEKPEGREVA